MRRNDRGESRYRERSARRDYRYHDRQGDRSSPRDYVIDRRPYYETAHRNYRVERLEGRGEARREMTSRKRSREDARERFSSHHNGGDSRDRSSKRPRRQQNSSSSSNPWNGWSASSSSSDSKSTNRVSMIETNPKRLNQRQKQIDYGKNTIGYDNYVKSVPKKQRRGYKHDEPGTPEKQNKYSKRQWAGIIRAWRRCLHKYDNVEVSSSSSSKEKDCGGRPDDKNHSEAAVATDETNDEIDENKQEEHDEAVVLDDKELEEFENDDLL